MLRITSKTNSDAPSSSSPPVTFDTDRARVIDIMPSTKTKAPSSTSSSSSSSSSVSSSSSDLGGEIIPPVSTTKAFLLTVLAPRVHRVYIPSDDENDDDNDDDDDDDEGAKEDDDNNDIYGGGENLGQRKFSKSSRSALLVGYSEPSELIGEMVEEDMEEDDAEKGGGSGGSGMQSERDAEKGEDEYAMKSGRRGDDDEDDEVCKENLASKEEMEHVVKINFSSFSSSFCFSNEDGNETHENEGGEVPIPIPQTLESPFDKVRSFFGVKDEGRKDAPTIFLGRAESIKALTKSVAVGIQDDEISGGGEDDDEERRRRRRKIRQSRRRRLRRPNTEIRVEALLRLTFRDLFDDGHLYDAPTYSYVTKFTQQQQKKQQQPIEGDGRGEDDGDEDPSGGGDSSQSSWVQITALVPEESIGIALERVERIGVGTSIGAAYVCGAQVCRAARGYAVRAKKGYGDGGGDEDDESVRTGRGEEEKAGEGVKSSLSGTKPALKGGGIDGGGGDDDESYDDEDKKRLDAAREEWRNAARRLRVEKVREQIQESASISFDFLSLLVIASILAGIGLVTDSTVVIVASMLVSPIMGPVMGMTFGGNVCDWELVKSSAMNECSALLLAVAIGVVVGLTASWSEGAPDWPTNEMLVRGDRSGLLTGIAIAIPSGMGVALSIIGNNNSSLVGVAISASLLPPAVNAGICWFHALLLRTGAVPSQNDYEDFLYIGGISFALTLVNIVCIWMSGMLMFAIKEIAPIKAKSAFWSNEVKVARNINKGTKSKRIDREDFHRGLKEGLGGK